MAPGPADPLPEIDIQARLVTRPSQLAGRTVNLPQDSAYRRTMVELSDEISRDIHVVEMGEKIQDETLAQKVARGEVQFTVIQKNLADLKEAEFKNLKVRPILGQTHSVSWAVRKNSPELMNELNRWIEEKKNGPLFDSLYRKYFIDRRRYLERVQSEYLTSTTGKLSEFDPLIKQYAEELGWDWRLLASQAFQESRFKPAARSWAGAIGLLQLMPATAREFGVQDALDPADNVKGAVKFLKWLQAYWAKRITDENERLKFILASYNTGAGHVEDAQRLTEKYGGNPQVWEDVSYWLLQKSTQQYSSDVVVKFGFCRGLEPVISSSTRSPGSGSKSAASITSCPCERSHVASSLPVQRSIRNSLACDFDRIKLVVCDNGMSIGKTSAQVVRFEFGIVCEDRLGGFTLCK